MYRIIGIFILFLFPFILNAQFNVKIGYGMGFVQGSQNNALVQAFNANPIGDGGAVDLVQKFPNLNMVYGIGLGLRYKLTEGNAIELCWDNLSRATESFGKYQSNGQLFEDELTYSFNQFYFSYQSAFGRIGLGSSIGINRVKIKSNIQGSNREEVLVPDNQYFARINLAYNIESSYKVALSIQPYYQIPISKVDLSGLSTYLGATGIDTQESYPLFGISLVFYNGRQ